MFQMKICICMLFICLIEFDYNKFVSIDPPLLSNQMFSYPRTNFIFYANPYYLMLVFLSTRTFSKCTLNFQRIISILCHLITKHVHHFPPITICGRIKCFFFVFLFFLSFRFMRKIVCVCFVYTNSLTSINLTTSAYV